MLPGDAPARGDTCIHHRRHRVVYTTDLIGIAGVVRDIRVQVAVSSVKHVAHSHAVRVGDLLFCAGQIPLDPKDGSLVADDIKVQTDRVLKNIKAILDDQGLTFANVVKSTVFLTDLANFAGMNEIYAKYFTENFPARSTIQVAGLPKAANVEIEVIAHF